jgi:hypothetical protein
LKAWAPWHGQDGDFFEEEASSKITRLYHAARSGPRFARRFFALLAGYDNLTAPLFALSQ